MKHMVFSLDTLNRPALQSDIDAVLSILYQSNIAYRAAIGVYKGVAEKSWIVGVETADQERLVRSIANAYGQESLLSICTKSLEVTKIYLMNRKKQIVGHWVRTNKINKKAMTLDLNSLAIYEVK